MAEIRPMPAAQFSRLVATADRKPAEVDQRLREAHARGRETGRLLVEVVTRVRVR